MNAIPDQLFLGAAVLRVTPVILADVRSKRNIVRIERPFVHVVEDFAHRLLIRRQRIENRDSVGRVVARPDFDGGPEIREMQRRMPHTGAAHGKTPQRHTFRIDLVGFLRELHGLENISLSRPVIGVFAAAEQIDLQGAGKIIDLRPLPGVEGLNLVETGKASVLGDIQRKGSCAIIIVGNGDADRLHRAIQRRAEAANHAPLLCCPG